MYTTRSAWRGLSAGVVTGVIAAMLAGTAIAQGAPPSPLARTMTLAEVFRMISTQPALAAAEARARAARGSRTTARSLGNPMLGYQVVSASTKSGAPMLDREAMATATLPLDALYQWWPRADRGDAAVRAALSDVAATRQRVLVEAARAYHRLGVAQVAVSVSRDLAAWLDSLVSYNRIRVREGVASESDLIRSELERGRAGATVALMEADLARARADLAQFVPDALARGPALVAVVPDRPMPLPAEAVPGANSGRAGDSSADDPMIAVALRANPELRAARERELAASAGVSLERLSIVRRADATVGTKSVGGATALVLGASLPLPLFDQNRGEIARASGERDAVREEFQAVERRVRADVAASRDAAVVLVASATELASPGSGGGPQFLQRADEARRIALGAYREGGTPLIQLLDVARAWGDAHMTFVQLIAAQRDSVFALLASLGIDLTSTPLPLDGSSR